MTFKLKEALIKKYYYNCDKKGDAYSFIRDFNVEVMNYHNFYNKYKELFTFWGVDSFNFEDALDITIKKSDIKQIKLLTMLEENTFFDLKSRIIASDRFSPLHLQLLQEDEQEEGEEKVTFQLPEVKSELFE